METENPTSKSLSADRSEALLQMQKMDPLCKHISKQLSNGKVPKNEADLFIHVKGLLYKHVTDSQQNFLTCDPQGMEVHSISRSTWQTRTPRMYTDLFLNKMTVLLERDEQI